MPPYQKIVDLLKTANADYLEIDHAPIFTTDDAAKVEGLSLEAGAKSLLLKAKDKFVLIVLSGGRRLDSKKLKKTLGVKDMRFASPAEVKDKMGCIVGACYPFGSIAQLDTYLDNSLLEHKYISFNPGIHNKSLKIKLSDYLAIENPTQIDVAE